MRELTADLFAVVAAPASWHQTASMLRAFVLQDLWGAGFFHLVAGLIIAGLFGTLTALAIRAVQRLPRSTADHRVSP